ncbi:MAG: RICIN domain-containing protein, partial [Oligoflexales bacterium]|nr:RICIN domain-containing protein [Oligoflexales bacterium]
MIFTKETGIFLTLLLALTLTAGACGKVNVKMQPSALKKISKNIGNTGNVAYSASLLLPSFPYNMLPVEIKNIGSGKCLDVHQALKADGTKVEQYTCHALNNQSWYLIPNGDATYQIRAGHDGNRNLVVPGASMDDGVELEIQNQINDGQIFL